MPSNPRLLEHPACREMAEKMAAEWFALVHGCIPEAWEEITDSRREVWTQAGIRLLSDLSRPASRDAWVRWLGPGRRSFAAGHRLVDELRDDPVALLAAIEEVPRG